MKKIILMLLMFAPLSLLAQQKFGHLNAQEVMASMPEFIKARGELEAMAKQYENDVKALQDELQRKSSEYEQKKASMTAQKAQEAEAELQAMYGKIQQTFQDNQQALQKAQQEKMTPITNKLVDAIKAVGKNGNYVYIMDISMGIPYISDTQSKDVTADVKTQLTKMK